jgi:integrase
MLAKDLRSEHHIVTTLGLLISLDRFFDGLPFTSINSKEQILAFLDHQYIENKGWVKRNKDTDGKYITTFNQYHGLLRMFFRWLYNTDNDDSRTWKTPSFIEKIKTKRPLRDSPYSNNDIWQPDEVQTIVQYESELRNQAIITLLWDLDARNHEITSLRLKDIVLNEQYGEGTIPSNTKTGGGPILLTSSFTYVRDWINIHPFKNESDARLICSLYNGAPIKSDAIRDVLVKLRSKIMRLVRQGSITDQKQRQKLEYLLRTKKWNPYCFRHSAITDDSNHLPEFALKKKVRWKMNSKQGNRYIRNSWSEDLRNNILEHSGIEVANKQPRIVQRKCGSCGHINSLSNKYCENNGCRYPLTQEALDQIKATEQSKFQELVNKSNLERDNTIQVLQQELKSRTQEIQSLSELCKHTLELSSKQNGTISDMRDTLQTSRSHADAKFNELLGLYDSLRSKFDRSVSITKAAFGRIDELQNIMKGRVLIKPDKDTAEELNRRIKILLQVAPDWQKRTTPVNDRLTPEEERKVMELINQSK